MNDKDIRKLVQNALQQDPGKIIVGEVNSAEAIDFLQK
jgi:Flp pilus assembly CpaF family ATPase